MTPPAGSGTVVVGLTSEDMGGVLGSVHVTTKIDGAPASDEVLVVLGNPAAFPKEIKLTAPPANPTAHIEVRVDGYLDPAWAPTKTDNPIVTRLAETNFVDKQDLLLRVRLEQRCLTGGLGGGFNGPVCTVLHQTCIGSICHDDSVSAADLETYIPNWANAAPDVCKPANAGAPQVIVGTGQTDYLALVDGQSLKVELGPQGGHHVWIAVRTHNLRQSGSTTTITGVQPGTNLKVPPTSFVFTFDRDEGGYCKLSGLRYQLDNGGLDYHQFLGKPLDVSVVVADTGGTQQTGVAHINIDSQVLCPSGQTCN